MKFPLRVKYLLLPFLVFWTGHFYGQCPGTCDITISGANSTDYTLNAGDTLCITSTGNYTGKATMNGGVLFNCASAPQTFDLEYNTGGGKVVNHGTLKDTDDSHFEKNVIIKNYGTFNFTGNQDMKDGAEFHNHGTFTLSGELKQQNSANGLWNYASGTITTTKLDVDEDLYNAGSITSTGECRVHSPGVISIDGGCLTCASLHNHNIIQGLSCGTVNISGNSDVLGGSSITGYVAIVDPSAPGYPYVDNNSGTVDACVTGTSCGCTGPTNCIVTNTNNSGCGSLREAINCANASPVPKTIEFQIPNTDPGYDGGRGVYTINLTTLLPEITRDSITIDGSTQSAFNGNTNTSMLGSGTTVGADDLANPQIDGPEIEIVDNNSLVMGIEVDASYFIMKGIAIYGFGDNSNGNSSGNFLVGDNGANLTDFLVENCVIGTEADSFTSPPSPNQGGGLTFMDCANITVQDNVIGYNQSSGIAIIDANCTNTLIQRNDITSNGTSSAYFDGIDIKEDAASITIRQNLISGNGALGVDCWSCLSNVTIEQNDLATNGISPSATEKGGIRFTGSGQTISKNKIYSNNGAGIILMPQDGSVDNSPANNILITQNEFYSNNTNAIDLVDVGGDINLGDGITPNSSAPADCGYTLTSGNEGIDAPVIDSLIYNPGTGVTTVYGRACPNGTVELYRNLSGTGDESNGSYFGEGVEYKGNVSADGTGNFSTNLSGLNTGHSITAIVYDGSNNTSEFGRAVSVDCMRDPLVWLKADAGFSAGTWTDQGSHGNNGTNAGNPTQVSNSLNFNPGINYDGDDQTTINLPEMVFDNGYNHVMGFMVYTPSTAATNIGMLGNNSASGLCNYFIGNNMRGRGNGCTSMPTAFGTYPHLMTYEADEENLVTGANSRLYFSGASVSQYLYDETSAGGVNTSFHVGSSGTGAEGWYFQGDVHEFMLYYADNGAVSISENQRKKIQSYLAMKYGLTLNHDYLDSQGHLIKDINDGYSWGMACIGKDTKFNLDQPKSISSNPYADIIIGSNDLCNGDFVMLGNNGLPIDLTLEMPYAGSLINASEKTWKIEKIGEESSINIEVNARVPIDFLIVSSDPEFLNFELIVLNEINSITFDLKKSAYFKLGTNSYLSLSQDQ